VTIHAAFTKELAGLQNRDYRFLAVIGYYGELDLAFLNVENRVGDVALRKHVLILAKFQYRLARADHGVKDLSVKRAVDCRTLENLLLLTKVTQQHYHGWRRRSHRSVKLA
jgi:hypothetical protein